MTGGGRADTGAVKKKISFAQGAEAKEGKMTGGR